MAKEFYLWCDGSGLITEREKRNWIARYGMTEDEFYQSDVEISPMQTELESICEWFQHMDMNGFYVECAEELRDPSVRDHDKTFLFNVDALISIVCEWMHEDFESAYEFSPCYITIMTRLVKLREEVTK